MPAKPLSEEQLNKVAAAYVQSGRNQTLAAKTLGIPRCTFQSQLRTAALRGLLGTRPVLPGFEIAKISTRKDKTGKVVGEQITTKPEVSKEQFEMPDGHRLARSTVQVNSHGEVERQWLKTSEGKLDPIEVAEELKATFESWTPPAVANVEFKGGPVSEDILTLYPLADWHIGMFSWGKETGQNWDIKIAERVLLQSAGSLIARAAPSARAVVLVGGDLLHGDNMENRTAKSGHSLDVDGRWQKVLSTACQIVVQYVTMVAEKHEQVLVRVLPGNHDEHSSIAVAYFLQAWFKDTDRITIDVDPGLFFFEQFGKVMLAATHGHMAKLTDMPQIMAHRKPEMWGATRYRYNHGFHIHHSSKFATEGGGVISESHQAPIPQDAWHHNSGFLSGRSMQAISYHREYGEIGRVRVAIIDA